MDNLIYWCNRLHGLIATHLYYVPLGRKVPGAFRVGLLSTAIVDPSALIFPALTSLDVILYAIASSDQKVAQSLAKQYSFQKSYESCEALLSDPAVDFVYVALPPHLRFDWVFKALSAGKHVLLDKPFALNGPEASELMDHARKAGKVLMETSPSQFHPSVHRLKELLNSGGIGHVFRADVSVTTTTWLGQRKLDPRWQYQLGGGSLISMGDAIGLCRFILHLRLPAEIIRARATTTLNDPRVDTSMTAVLRYRRSQAVNASVTQEHDLILNISTDLSRRWLFGIIPRFWELPTLTIETEKAHIIFYNISSPHLFHYIAIKDKSSGIWKYHWLYKSLYLSQGRGAMFWSSQRYQLEAFVDKLKGRESVCWTSSQENVMTSETIDMLYRKSELPIRPSSMLASSTFADSVAR
ncbi:putative NAD binding Rossmann fold oxidoreductase [Crepidotus variabilis]|uniref:D-xylose 1-dehydrogenase (NADP(+), D-xylono-1,5-lactone-forming) n=1 Tax=Crepidotus variabilis TaxID=179855 RepID=A0A9P6E8I8_9AGAR|nr:putative NAD binding Rossmann fold oxidoreductase [Crepidotus variabilis]